MLNYHYYYFLNRYFIGMANENVPYETRTIRMNQDTIGHRFELYMTPGDGRFEKLTGRRRLFRNTRKDLVAGIISAAIMIPLAMGFAMASGLHPEQGVAGGAVAALIGALFGGSKYQVYGPSAALIPVIGGLMAIYDTGFLLLASFIAGILLLLSGLLKLGRITEKIPRSAAVGLTLGMVLIIIFSQVNHATGLHGHAGYKLTDQLRFWMENIYTINIAALTMTVCTCIICQAFIRISRFIPGLFLAMAFGYFGAKTFWSGKGVELIGDKYTSLADGFFTIASTTTGAGWGAKTFFDLLYFSVAIFTVVLIESTSSGRRADRLAPNEGHPFNPHKELWGNGIINIFSPVFNGMPVCGTWTGTSANTRTGAISPLSGLVRCGFILLLSASLISYIEKVPLACMAGILLSVAINKVKRIEIKEVFRMGTFHFMLMIATALMVPLFGFVPAVLISLSIYILFRRGLRKKIKEDVINQQEEVVV
ncbi:MAG: SulP family inorganic anion transporter [Chitinophagaceae bacterium]|nr:SulP family inorganic anion transporter [Chitinophagaceae bacterium]